MDSFTICLLGDVGVGKTSLMKAYSGQDLFYNSLINVFVTHFGDHQIQWWDFNGDSQYEDFRKLFYKYFDGYVFVHDLSNSKTLKNLNHWEREIEAWINDSLGLLNYKAFPILIVGNKSDLKKGTLKESVETHTSALNRNIASEDWNNFLSKVVARQGKDELTRANQMIENYNCENEIEVNWLTKIKNWLRPPELPFFKKKRTNQ